jgi:hypothetical protein
LLGLGAPTEQGHKKQKGYFFHGARVWFQNKKQVMDFYGLSTGNLRQWRGIFLSVALLFFLCVVWVRDSICFSLEKNKLKNG